MGNALLHMSWVTVLTICQSYQVVCLGMTTNERLNRGRYRHFQAKGGKSPFNRGPVKNLFDFLECSCFGLVQPQRTDWMQFFDTSELGSAASKGHRKTQHSSPLSPPTGNRNRTRRPARNPAERELATLLRTETINAMLKCGSKSKLY
uniref:Secreted protein n=1 Tax=Anopheles melas TaxID=34690 RepID=A0A182U4E9_9DIPT